MFDDYYSKYLGIDNGIFVNGCMVCKSEIRNIPLNQKFLYRIIITDYEGFRVVSVSPSILDSVIYNICSDIRDKAFDEILKSQQLYQTGLRLNKMYRMIIDDTRLCNNNLGNLKFEYLRENRKYVIRDSDSILSYCKISNIDFKFGNIVVWTDENSRLKGYAKELLSKTILKCKTEGMEPLYLVDSQNTASIKLAKSVGFKIVQNEIIAGEVMN